MFGEGNMHDLHKITIIDNVGPLYEFQTQDICNDICSHNADCDIDHIMQSAIFVHKFILVFS